MDKLVITGLPILICEGGEELAFVKALIQSPARALPATKFDLNVIGSENNKQGIDALRHHLFEVAALTDFPNVTEIVLLADSDEDPKAAMEKIRKEIRVANGTAGIGTTFPIPRSAYKRWKKGNLTFTVILQPGNGKPGCLETSVWEAMTRLHGAKTRCVEALLTCAGINFGAHKWGKSKLDKARVRAGIAVMLRNNGGPALPLTQIWTRSPQSKALAPIDAAEFDTVHNYLSGY